MAAWNLESVGTKGLGGGGGLICGKVARAWINKKKQNDRAAYDGVGIFKDPMMDAVYGQRTSSTRAGVPRPDVSGQPNTAPSKPLLHFCMKQLEMIVKGSARTERPEPC